MIKETISMEKMVESLVESVAQIQEQLFAMQEDMNQRFDRVDQRLDHQETWLNRIEAKMATKVQLNVLVGVLQRNNVISQYDAAHITHPETNV